MNHGGGQREREIRAFTYIVFVSGVCLRVFACVCIHKFISSYSDTYFDTEASPTVSYTS
jgi:hypothetical protein